LKYLATIILILCASASLASDVQSHIKNKLHKASENIERFSNHELINDSLYEQIRTRANITNKKLSANQIDKKVRKYVSEKYAPALVKNYELVYSELRAAKKDFSTCKNVTPIKSGEDVLKALCLKEENKTIKVQYMTNGYSQGWSKAAVFVFSDIKGVFQLISIELQFKEGTKAYVEGI